MIFDLEHLEGVHVHDDLEPGDRVGVRVAAGFGAQPDVAPAQPAVAQVLRHHRGAVRPDVEQHQIWVIDAAGGQRGEDALVLVQGMVDLVVLVDGEVRARPRDVRPGLDSVTGQVDDGFVSLVGAPVPQDGERAPGHRILRAARP